MSNPTIFAVDDFELQPRGPYLFETWRATAPITSRFGDCVVNVVNDLGDTRPPNAQLVKQANDLVAVLTGEADAVHDKVFEHYLIIAQQEEWMRSCRVPTALTRAEVVSYILECSIDVSRPTADEEPTAATIRIVPQWEDEHQIFLAVRGGKLEFAD